MYFLRDRLFYRGVLPIGSIGWVDRLGALVWIGFVIFPPLRFVFGPDSHVFCCFCLYLSGLSGWVLLFAGFVVSCLVFPCPFVGSLNVFLIVR